jgi:hypothetical protein
MIQHFVSSPDGALASRLSQPPKPRTTISGGQRLGTEWLAPTHSDTQSQTNRTRSGQVKYNRRGAALLQNVELMPKHQDFGFKPSSRLAAAGDRIVNRALALRNDCENSARRRGFAKNAARPCSQAHCLEMDATMTIGVVTMLYRFIGTLPRGKR